MIFWIWSVTLLLALVLYFRQIYSKFSRYAVKHFTPVPLLGNMWRFLLGLDHFTNEIEQNYNHFPEERFVGKYEFMKPVVFVRDLELVKKITIKDFEYFLDHRTFVSEKDDPFMGRMLFSLKGQEWKDMRSTLSPAFTSSKIRLMVPFMVEAGKNMIQSLQDKVQTSKKVYIDSDVRDLITRYANDVIASCAFGLNVDSQKDHDNQFYMMGREATNITFKQILVLFACSYYPKLMKALKLSFFSKNVKAFFRDLVMNTMKDREERHIIRPDMIHLLMEAKKGKLKHNEKTSHDTDAGFATVEESNVGKKYIKRGIDVDLYIVWTDNDLIAQAVIFFLAGFETASSAMSFLLYELAVNPDVQEKLLLEIKENEAKNGGKFDYASIQQMTYMDMVISELLRLWPPVFALDRVCNKNYNLGRPNDKATKDYIIRKGESLHIPVWAIHHDPKFFPKPLRFDPERFSDENKHNIKPITYMPFGLGPRNCIGSRFALCEVKVIAYQLLLAFELSPSEKTQIPVQLCNANANLRMKGGHWLRLRLRNQTW